MSALALLGGTKAKTKPLPAWPYYDGKEEQALKEVLESRVWWRTPGTKTLEFEQAFAEFHGAQHGVAVTNGTAALEVTMGALGITTGDEVIVPNFTFVATASAVLFANALPVLVDVNPETYCIDPDLVEAAITPRTKAVIAVHMGGHPADLDRLTKICKRHRIALVEDSAHAHATEWRGQRIGTFGVAATFSFQLSKLMTAGEGGIIITSNDKVERQARSIHDCGRMPGITPQKLDQRCTRNGQYAYIFHVNKKQFAGVSTERFIEAMSAEGIPNQASYPPLHQLDMFRNGKYRNCLSGKQATQKHTFLKQKFPVTQKAAWETVWIPQPALLGDEADMHEMAAALSKIQKNAKELS